MTREDNYVEHLLQVGEGFAGGLRLEQLGFEPRLADLTADGGAAHNSGSR